MWQSGTIFVHESVCVSKSINPPKKMVFVLQKYCKLMKGEKRGGALSIGWYLISNAT